MEGQIQTAVKQFQELFSDEKIRNKKEQWKSFFLSELFLNVQFSEAFSKQIKEYLKNQNFVPYNELPPAYLFELVTAYGLEPFINQRDGFIYADFMEEDFYNNSLTPWFCELSKSRRTASEIWNSQDNVWRVQRGSKTIRKWEYRLRGRAFEDYIELCIDYEAGNCDWEKYDDTPFVRGKKVYIQEGRFSKTEYGTFIRNECILKLYEYFLRTRKLPLSVCSWIYQMYELSNANGVPYAKRYEGIRQALLAQYPDLESYADKEKEHKEDYRQWTLRLYDIEKKYKYDGWAVKPVVPYEYTYALSKPVVSEQEKNDLKEILSDSIFCVHKYDDFLIEDLHYHFAGGNATLGMAEAFYNVYSECSKKSLWISRLLEYIKARINYYYRIPEYLCFEPYSYDLSMDSPDFWYYYLIKAFEGRYIEVELPEYTSDIDMEDIEDMEEDSEKYLSEYLEELYQPSLEWRRRFVGSDKTGKIDEPKSIEVVVLMELVIKIEFHLHYILFFIDGEPWNGETFSFKDLLEYAGKEGQEKRFVLLLPLTYIENEECEYAYEEIRKRLKKLPIDEFCIDFTAACISNGNPISPASEEVYYMENLTGACRAEIYESGAVFMQNTPRGWQINNPNVKNRKEKTESLLFYGLNRFKPPVIKEEKIVVEGMSNIQKAQKICELLKKNSSKSLLSYKQSMKIAFVYPFLKEHSFLYENNVVLCYGNQDRCYFEKPLYTKLYSDKEIVSDEYAVTKREKNYKIGEMFQDWDLQRTILSVGESGKIWYFKSLAKMASAESLAEIIAERYRLDEVTAIYSYLK